MGDLRDSAEQWLENIGKVGRGDPVDGVFVMTNEEGLVTFDHDGQPVEPDDPKWNRPEKVEERLVARRAKKGK